MENKFFILAGAQRSGTTFLAQTLASHPQIAMAEPFFPEPKYFLPGRRTRYSREEYLELFFKHRKSGAILGEKTVSYFETAGVPELIAAYLPGVRLIFMLRDPVYRAVSNYFFSKEHGFEKRPLEEAFAGLEDLEPENKAAGLSASPYAYLKRGHYADLLEPFEKQFGRGKLLILIQENWAREGCSPGPILNFIGAGPAAGNAGVKSTVWKTSLDPVQIPVNIQKRLAAYYADENKKLAGRYSLEINSWTRP